jgi:hypothetical protein
VEEKPPEDPEFGEDEPECAGAFGIMLALGHLFQDDLNEFYLNPVIKVFYWYAWFFTNLMVYLTYGGGMPLMYPLGILFFILNFYVEKFLFCCFHRKTFGFDESLPNRSVKLMKWGIFLHLLMNVFMYTDKRLMAPVGYDTDQHYRPTLEPPAAFFRRRYDNLPSQAVLLVFVGVCVLYIIFATCIRPCSQLVRENKAKRR